jgi:threonine/homoserine/homoserine lactone efflux protein
VLSAFIAGAIAGYAIAIPVGAIAILIVDHGIRRGFRNAAAAGAGAATADFVYASLAIVGGATVAPVLAPISVPLRVAAVVVLLVIGIRALAIVARTRGGTDSPGAAVPGDSGVLATYGQFVGLTLLNPTTVVYFAALVLALPQLDADPLARPAFVLGALVASLSWQTLLAAIGAIAHHRLPPRFRVGLSLLGSLMICGFALALARTLV